MNAHAPVSMMMSQKQLNLSRRGRYYIVNKVNKLFYVTVYEVFQKR